MGGLGLTILYLAAYFYSDDGLVESTQPERLQRAFDILTDLFNRVGLRKTWLIRLAWYASHTMRWWGCVGGGLCLAGEG